MSRTTTTTYHRRLIPWFVLIILATIKVFANAEQQPNDHHLHDETRPHGHEQGVEASPIAQQQDRSEHVHGEHCDHDHANEHTATVPKDGSTPDTKETPPARNNHQHDHSHNHSHGHPSKPPPKFTPLMESIRDDNHDAFRKLLSDPSVNINHFQTDWPMCALFYTFVLRKYDYTTELLNKDVDVTLTNADGISALKLALKTVKDEEMKFMLVTMLLERGAVVEADLQEELSKLMDENISKDEL